MDVTTIAGASAFQQQQQIANNVQSSVAAKVHDSQKTQGAAVLKLLDSATVPPSADGSLDLKA